MRTFVNFKATTRQLGMIYGRPTMADYQTYPITNCPSEALQGEKYCVGTLIPDWVDLGKIPQPKDSFGTLSHAIIAHDGHNYLAIGFGGNRCFEAEELQQCLEYEAKGINYDFAKNIKAKMILLYGK